MGTSLVKSILVNLFENEIVLPNNDMVQFIVIFLTRY